MASENGWEPPRAGADILEWVRVPGAEHVSLQFMKGWPSIIMRAYAADYHVYIEPLRDADSASFTPTNSVATSNHLNGTAMDLNWNDHPFRVDYAGFDIAKIARMRDLLRFYNFEGLQIMFWAQDWSNPKDAMHHQMGYRTWNNPIVGRFIAERIRPDGFSTYKRDGTTTAPPPQVSKADRYALDVMAEGRRRGITPRGIQIAFSVVFVESGWKMYANSSVPESMTIPHDAVGSDHDSVGLFQQRCPMWGPANVLMDPAKSAGLFFDRLAKMDYNNPSRLPGDFAADVQRPAAQYRGRYQERMGDAVALYNRLSGVATDGEDELSAEAEAMIREIRDELKKKFVSRSPLRPFDAQPNDTMAGYTLYADGNTHWLAVKFAAEHGHPESLGLLNYIASGDPTRYPDRASDIQLAQAILADMQTVQAQPLSQMSSDPAPYQYQEPQVVYVDRPVSAPLPAVVESASSASLGDVVKTVVDAVEQLKLSDALSNQDYATLDASIKILQMKNGTQV